MSGVFLGVELGADLGIYVTSRLLRRVVFFGGSAAGTSNAIHSSTQSDY